MINGYSAKQIRAAEEPLLAAGVPLMHRAAAGLAVEIGRALAQRPNAVGRVLVLAGAGNNGGDALYAGAALATDGVEVIIVTTGSRVHEAALAAALAAGAERAAATAGSVTELAASVDVIVDGILGTGTGANPALRGAARDIAAALLPMLSAPKRPFVIAVDIPSGINPSDGSVPDPLVLTADVTVTFGGYKAGLLIEPGARYAGRVLPVDIGLEAALEKLTPLVSVPE